MPDPKLAEEIDRARGRPDASKLFGYIWDNFDLITQRRTQGDSWKTIQTAIAARGIVDANGNEPKVSAIKTSYQRAEKAKLKEKQPPLRGRPPIVRQEFAQGEYRHSSKLFPKD